MANKLSRRKFLSMVGASTTGAVLFTACGIPDQELIVQSPLELPEDLVRGNDQWYATICGICEGGEGVIVRVMEGRAKKVAGNPDFPINHGKQSVRCDTALQMLYHPDRIATPLARAGKNSDLVPISWTEAEKRLLDALDSGRGRMTVATNPVRGHTGWVANNFANVFGGRHIAFDAFEQGVLHGAVKDVLGANVLPDLDIGNASTILSFGADFLSTWVSPVRYSVKYGQFRGRKSGRGTLIHVEPRMSMTAANADQWLSPKPGTEGILALAIARIITEHGLASDAEIEAFEARAPRGKIGAFSVDDVESLTGLRKETVESAARAFATQRPSLAIGGGTAGAYTNGSFNLSAIWALNYLVSAVGNTGGVLFNPESPLRDVPASAHGAPFEDWEKELAQWRAGNVETVIVRGANLVHALPRSVDVAGAIRNVRNVVAFATVLDDTAAQADLVLPEKTFLEEWDTDIPEPGPAYQVVGFQQPVVSPPQNLDGTDLISDSRSFGDVLLWASGGALGVGSMRELVQNAAHELFALNRGTDSVKAPSASLFMNGILRRGGWWDLKSTPHVPDLPVKSDSHWSDAEFSSTADVDGTREFYLVPFMSNSLLDGRTAATPWGQASPDPMSTGVWDTWVEINTVVAQELQISLGDRIFLRTSTGEVEVLAYPHPGLAPDVLGVPVGQGHENFGRYAEGRGANILSILVDKKDEKTGALAWASTKVKLLRAGGRRTMAKFEGTVPAFPVEPGVPILVVGHGQTAHEAKEQAHHEHLRKISE